MNLTKHVAALTDLIKRSQTLEAMERFYAGNVTMQENEEPLRIGKLVCLAHERQMLENVSSIQAKLINQAINEQTGIVFSEWHFSYTNRAGKEFPLSEVSV